MRTADSAFENMPDTDVMIRVQWGSERAFAELYGRYFRKLLDFFYAMSRDVQVAEDLCHETFLRLWQLRHRYAATGSFSGYLFTVARNIWFERRRQMAKQWRLGVVAKVDEDKCSEKGMLSREVRPDQAALRKELDEKIFAALRDLPEEQRMAFILRTIDGLSLEDIAAIMECPVNTVRSRRMLAIKRLRAVLRGLWVAL